jgi:hypothetical protein
MIALTQSCVALTERRTLDSLRLKVMWEDSIALP